MTVTEGSTDQDLGGGCSSVQSAGPAPEHAPPATAGQREQARGGRERGRGDRRGRQNWAVEMAGGDHWAVHYNECSDQIKSKKPGETK